MLQELKPGKFYTMKSFDMLVKDYLKYQNKTLYFLYNYGPIGKFRILANKKIKIIQPKYKEFTTYNKETPVYSSNTPYIIFPHEVIENIEDNEELTNIF